MIEQKLAAARAAKQRSGITKHYGIMRALYPKLRAAIEAAAAVQGEIVAARQAAVGDLGEHLADLHIPKCAYLGFILPDLVALWTAEQERVWASKPASVTVQPPAPVKPPAAKPRPVISSPATPAPRAARQPIRDSAPAEGDDQKLLQILRSGVELDDGRQCAVGDVVRLRSDKAVLLLRSGAAEEIREKANG